MYDYVYPHSIEEDTESRTLISSLKLAMLLTLVLDIHITRARIDQQIECELFTDPSRAYNAPSTPR